MKYKLTSSPILGHPDLDTAQYIIDTDASQYCVAAVLKQIQNRTDKVIAYTSQHLDYTESNWSTFEKELFAIVHAVKTFQRIRIWNEHYGIHRSQTSGKNP